MSPCLYHGWTSGPPTESPRPGSIDPSPNAVEPRPIGPSAASASDRFPTHPINPFGLTSWEHNPYYDPDNNQRHEDGGGRLEHAAPAGWEALRRHGWWSRAAGRSSRPGYGAPVSCCWIGLVVDEHTNSIDLDQSSGRTGVRFLFLLLARRIHTEREMGRIRPLNRKQAFESIDSRPLRSRARVEPRPIRNPLAHQPRTIRA